MENTELIDFLKTKLRGFFDKKGVEEIEIGNNSKILNGSVNFNNLLKFEFNGLEYPLPETTLFSLEPYYMKSQFGVYTFSEIFEYHENGDPIKKLVCEFILKGDERMMSIVNSEIINSLGFSIPMTLNHQDILRKYTTNKIDDDIRIRINSNLGNVVTIKNYPIEEYSNWFVKSINNEYQYKETILNDILIDNFLTERVYNEINEIYNLDLEERFLGQIDLIQLSKSFKTND